MLKDRLDNQIEGQMTIEDLFTPPEKLIAVSRVFASARKEMSLAEQKAFVFALTELKFTEEAKTNIVYMDKKELAKVVGIKSDPDHLSGDLRRAIGEISRHSFIEIIDEDKDYYDSGMIISRLTIFRNRVRLKFDDEYIGLFTGLSSNYITMWSSDIFGMNSKRSVQFYEFLRQETDSRNKINRIGLGIKALKEMFSIPESGKGSYMRDKGGFNRTEFEKKVIEPICEDLLKTKMIQLVVQPDGKPYEKVKRGRLVDGYRFFWTYTSRPGLATASEVAEIQERVDKNPQVLKVAKDIVKGQKKTKKKESFSYEENKRSEEELREIEDLLYDN